ncbi:putative oxidoreductase [Sphingobium sp. SYK-6]|uniref:flavin reductase family protein n=1 Tax=Sphingobium sp. (strain NBRC 103272 / SYK-6) TaxID=627192 RepID=UPI0002277A92|nr:flavin reductase family protein [Sphingobium sp. SYK-6]BAK68157.1 putative oxidoreductase [Sphingobium sp. SYK-6]
MSTVETESIALSLRAGLRRLAKAVVVITCRQADRRFAMTATAVSELSMDPPSLVICVNRSASLDAPLSLGAGFCVNILQADQQEIAAICAGAVKGEARFAVSHWQGEATDSPWLEDAQASFACRQDGIFDYGTHRMIIGRVERVRLHGETDPLVYVDGRYARVA